MNANLVKQLDGLIVDLDAVTHAAKTLRRERSMEELKRITRIAECFVESVRALVDAMRRESASDVGGEANATCDPSLTVLLDDLEQRIVKQACDAELKDARRARDDRYTKLFILMTSAAIDNEPSDDSGEQG